MNRIKRGSIARKRRKNILSLTKGFIGSHSKLFRIANQQRMKALHYAFHDRRKKKNNYKSLWLVRINSVSRSIGIKYSKMVFYLKSTAIIINRKVLAEITKQNETGYLQIIYKTATNK